MLALLAFSGARPACSYAAGAEHLAADVVAVDGLEAGLGDRESAVVETDLDDRGVEEPAIGKLRVNQSVGLCDTPG